MLNILVIRKVAFHIIHQDFNLVTGDLAPILLIPFDENAGHLLHVNPCQVYSVHNTRPACSEELFSQVHLYIANEGSHRLNPS